MNWRDLSDDELRARLEKRGLTRHYIASLVCNRDDEYVAGLITEALS